MPIKDQMQYISDIKEVSVAIDRWDDIFSDFDPSPISKRTLSEDFIIELQRRYKQTKRGSYAITIFAPKSLADEKFEQKVAQRLKQDFKFRALLAKKSLGRIRIRGAIFVVFGIFCLGTLILLTYSRRFSELALELIGIVLMPLGWFGIWEGFSKIVDTSFGLKRDEDLFTKLSKASYNFKHFE